MPRRGVFRAVYSVLFDDPDYQQLTPRARLLLLTLRQCSDAGPAAIFRYYPEKLAAQTGLSVATVNRCLSELEVGGWITKSYPVVWVRNALRYDPALTLANPKHAAYIRKWLIGLPRSEIVATFCDYYKIAYPFDRVSDRVSIGYRPIAITEDRIPNTGIPNTEDRGPLKLATEDRPAVETPDGEVTPPPETPDEQLAQIKREVAALSKRLGWR